MGWKFWKRHDLHWADGTIFMNRWTLFKLRWFSPKLHRFNKSDEEMHDHPWPFVSLVIWGSYIEETPGFNIRRGFLSLRYRPADWIHRVCVPDGRPAWTICITGPRVREWGFWNTWPNGKPRWIQHNDYRRANGRGRVTT